jgi:hypothetical protein
MWSKDIQNLIFSVLMTGWLGGFATEERPGEVGRLFTVEEVGTIVKGKFPRRQQYLYF